MRIHVHFVNGFGKYCEKVSKLVYTSKRKETVKSKERIKNSEKHNYFKHLF